MPLCCSRSQHCEVKVFLGQLESGLFEFLERKRTNSISLKKSNSSKNQIALFVYVEDVAASIDYTCTLPLTNSYDMIGDTCLYSLDSYLILVHKNTDRAMFGQHMMSEFMQQIVFSCFLVIAFKTPADTYTNIFTDYFRYACFVNEENNTRFRYTNIFRLYTYEIQFAFLKNSEVLNYVLIQYDFEKDLQAHNDGFNCLSEYDKATRDENDTISSFCVGNKHFQLILAYGNVPSSNLRFHLHVARNVFYMLFQMANIERDCGYEQVVQKDENFSVYLFQKYQKSNKICLTLKEHCVLHILITLYSGDTMFENLKTYIQTLNMSFGRVLYNNLSVYIFCNLFQLASTYFEGRLDQVYCLLFTCITLSDVNFGPVSNTSDINGGSIMSVFYYFYALFIFINSINSRDKTIVHYDRGDDTVFRDSIEVNECFGLYMKSYGTRADNFLKVRHEYVVNETFYRQTYLKRALINLDIFVADERV